MKSIGKRMYAMAPPTSSLSVLDTRLSAIRPPSKRRKFGNSFIVDMMVARGAGAGAADELVERALWGPRAERVDDAVEDRRFFADAVCERADCVLTYADLQVAAMAERRSMPTLAPTQPALTDQRVRPATASEQLPRKRL